MVHPDEGTIHAWLDGALAPDEAVTVEAHVRTCEQCSAAIAEARGFIAASSRILTALDDVPGEVIPGDRHSQPAVAHILKADAQRKRRFRQNFALAATLLFMVSGGLFVVNQTARTVAPMVDTADLGTRISEVARGDSVVSDVSGDVSADSVALPAVAANTSPAVESQARSALPATDASTPDRQVAGAGTSGLQAGAARAEGDQSSRVPVKSKGGASGAKADVATIVASAPPVVPVPPPATATAATASNAAAAETRSGGVGNVAGGVAAPTNTAPQVAYRRESRIDSVAVIAGCYQLASQADLSIADSRRDEAMVVAALPSRIRLTDSLVIDRNGDRRYLARSIIAGGVPVRRFAWSAAGGSLRLFVGDSVDAPAVRASMDSTATTTAPARLRRVACGN